MSCLHISNVNMFLCVPASCTSPKVVVANILSTKYLVYDSGVWRLRCAVYHAEKCSPTGVVGVRGKKAHKCQVFIEPILMKCLLGKLKVAPEYQNNIGQFNLSTREKIYRNKIRFYWLLLNKENRSHDIYSGVNRFKYVILLITLITCGVVIRKRVTKVWLCFDSL